MPRRYFRRSRSIVRPKKKYSWEHFNFVGTNGAIEADAFWRGNALLVSSTGIGGMRKTKNFTLTISVENFDQPLLFALVYVPQGTVPSIMNVGGDVNREDPNNEFITSVSLYEPNQNVILTGVIPAGQTAPVVKSTRMARNLNSGDSIYLVFRSLVQHQPLEADTVRFSVNLDYCISY